MHLSLKIIKKEQHLSLSRRHLFCNR